MTATVTGPGAHNAESHTTFFRQGSWLILATGLAGFFMLLTQIAAQKLLPPSEYVLFFALLRVYLLLGVPCIGLQTVFAQQAASAITADQQALLAATVRSVLWGAFVLWLGIALAAYLAQSWLLTTLGIGNPGALWATVALGLAALWLPVMRGTVQGRQHFVSLGWSQVVDGLGRFGAVAVILSLGGLAAGGVSGALIGQIAALAVCVWTGWDVLSAPGKGFVWGPWLRRVLPLTLGTGTLLLMTTTDPVYVKAVLPKEYAELYVPAAMVGLALNTLTAPVVAVMFPKIARSAALAGTTRAFTLALGATAGVTILLALGLTAFPELPVRVVFVGNPTYLKGASLVPLYSWAMVPLILANVLINNLLARGRFAVVPWVLAVGVAYLMGLTLLRGWLPTQLPTVAFRALLGLLGSCNLALLVSAIVFTRRDPGPVVAAAPSV